MSFIASRACLPRNQRSETRRSIRRTQRRFVNAIKSVDIHCFRTLFCKQSSLGWPFRSGILEQLQALSASWCSPCTLASRLDGLDIKTLNSHCSRRSALITFHGRKPIGTTMCPSSFSASRYLLSPCQRVSRLPLLLLLPFPSRR